MEVGENYVDICLKENQGETELRCSKKVTITWDITNAFSTTFSFNSVADVTLPYNPFYIKDDTNLVARLRLFYKKATDKYKIESHTHYIYVKSKKNTDIYDTCYSNNITTKNTETILQYEKEVKNKDKIVFNLQDEFHAPHQSNNCRDAIDRITLEIDISQYHLNLIWKCDNKNNPDMWECKRSEQ
ncbi:MAG: hypothetical protein D6732_21230 [Methanobacteriota archaeon]|nr:MAG: hypothetical protein D6732_21230 [Euryarchaeota archaeon]